MCSWNLQWKALVTKITHELQAQAIESDIPVSSKWAYSKMEFEEEYEESFLKYKDFFFLKF